MNILITIDKFEIGGIVSFSDNLANFLCKKGHKVFISGGISQNSPFPFKQYFNHPSIKISSFRINQHSKCTESINKVLGHIKTFSTIIKTKKIDLIVINHSSAIGVTLNQHSKIIPKIFHFHGSSDLEEKNIQQPHKEKGLKGRLKNIKKNLFLAIYHFLDQACIDRVDSIAVLSLESKKLMQNHYRIKQNTQIKILPSGVNLNLFKPPSNKPLLKNKLLIKNNIPVLLTICRFDNKKGIVHLLKALSKIKKSGYKFKAIIAGPINSGWFYNKNILKTYELLGLTSAVHFIHGLNQADKLSFMQASDIFIMPSTEFEAYPITLMEAISCGLYPIATAVGGIPNMLSGKKLRPLIRAGNVSNIVKEIKWFLNLNKIAKTKTSVIYSEYAKTHFNSQKRNANILSHYLDMLR